MTNWMIICISVRTHTKQYMHTPQHLINHSSPVFHFRSIVTPFSFFLLVRCYMTYLLSALMLPDVGGGHQSSTGSLTANPCLQPSNPTIIMILLPQSLKHRDYRICATISSLLLHTLPSPKSGLHCVLRLALKPICKPSLLTHRCTAVICLFFPSEPTFKTFKHCFK